jgi:hypothetical protein
MLYDSKVTTLLSKKFDICVSRFRVQSVGFRVYGSGVWFWLEEMQAKRRRFRD